MAKANHNGKNGNNNRTGLDTFNIDLDFDFERNPTWRIFRIMSEFVEGFSFLATIPKSVTFFGSSRLNEKHPYYIKARELARRLAGRGYAIVTGGGPGIMQAGNQGAHDVDGDLSIGLNIQLPHEQRMNRYVSHNHNMSFNFFFSRKLMLDFSAEAYIFFPGGFGTLDEFFEIITLIQTEKLDPTVPVILIGWEYWSPLIAWMRQTLLEQFKTVDAVDLECWHLTDDLDEVEQIVEAGVRREAAQRLKQEGHANKTASERLKHATRPMKSREQ
jgi:uncharacterized protein (TIGR00730 family)